MHRKDCDMRTQGDDRAATRAVRKEVVLLSSLACLVSATSAFAGEFRVWASGVVVADSIRLGDVVEFRDLDSTDDADSLRSIVVAEAPPPGGSRIIHHQLIRSVLTAKGVNLARIALVGAAQCEVRRPVAQHQ